MKVKKQKSGYNIRCSDGEFDALVKLVSLGEGAGKLQGNAKSGYTRRTKGGDFLRVDIDNRGA